MSRTKLEEWLNDELPASETEPFESWLRESSDNLELHFQHVLFQEQLRFQFRAPKPIVAQVSTSTRTLWKLLALCTAACVLITFYVMSRPVNVSPTADPLLFVVLGNPRVEITQLVAQPGPTPTARASATNETVVGTADSHCVVRWQDDYDISLQPNTSLKLRAKTSNPHDDEPHRSASSLRLEHGVLMLKTDTVDNPIDLWVADIKIRIESQIVMVLSYSDPDPIEPNVLLVIEKGSAMIRSPGVADRRVNAGERINLSTR